jgi:hypothetical protein
MAEWVPRYRSRHRESEPCEILESSPMKINKIGMQRFLQASSILVILGLLIELATVLWFHPLSFVLFAFVAAFLTGLGILIYLVSLIFVTTPRPGVR